MKYDAITYDEVLAKHLAVMDLTATSLAMTAVMPAAFAAGIVLFQHIAVCMFQNAPTSHPCESLL